MGLRSPPYTICKVETQESQGCGSVPFLRSEDLEAIQWCLSQATSEGLRSRSTKVQGQEKMNVPTQRGREDSLYCSPVLFEPSVDSIYVLKFLVSDILGRERHQNTGEYF